MKKLIILFAVTGFLSLPSQAQTIKTPPPSTPQFVRQDFGLSSIELSYSRPNVRGRKIFGDVVPFGKVWRTGANQATTLTFGDAVSIGGTMIPAGKYGLLSIPGADEWTLIITHQLDVTSPAAYKADLVVLIIKATPQPLSFSIETFMILFSDVTAKSCNLELIWHNTLVTLPITTDVDPKIMAEIDNAMNKDNHPYYQAGFYYLENGKDLNKALERLIKCSSPRTLAQAPFSSYIRKSRCLAKLNRKPEAIATAKKGIELAREAKNDDYVVLNEKLIASLQ